MIVKILAELKNAVLPDPNAVPELGTLVLATHGKTQALRVFTVPSSNQPRVNLITDSINSGSLLGGVSTSIVLASLLATRLKCPLRIVTRTEKAVKRNYAQVLAATGAPAPDAVEFAYIDFEHPHAELPVHDGDLFISTSWWTTLSIKRSIGAKRIIYLLQEDERGFYALGDQHLRCQELLQDADLTFVVNTELLFDYLVGDGLSNLEVHGMWFEPSWPKGLFYKDAFEPKAKRDFFFYARPNNSRNLYERGIEVIDAAIRKGILDPLAWNFHFAGKDLKPIRIHGQQVSRLQDLSLAEYAAAVRQMDLGLCLMYTPHPSYPPIDLAASGAISVTNTFGPKKSLDRYSANVICCEPDMDSLLKGLAKGAELSLDLKRRAANYESNRMSRDWTASFKDVLDRLEPWASSVRP